jgi:putative membrane protein
MSKAPRAFRLDDPGVSWSDAGTPPPGAGVLVTDTDDESVFEDAERRAERAEVHDAALGLGKRVLGWGGVLVGSLFGLATLWLATALETFIIQEIQRNPVVGWLAAALAALAAVALLVLAWREVRAIVRAKGIAALKARAEAVLVSDDRREGRAILSELVSLYGGRAETARARTRLAETAGDVIDGADLIRVAERELMAGLDREARLAIAGAARRVSVVTAISPRAIVDLLFVAAQALRLVRRISEIYGGRPGAIGFLRLLRAVGSHLAVTGGMAVGDSLVQQVLGHGLAAKLSARLGEGILNGLLTARVGLSAVAVCRPLPFAAEKEPTVSDVAGFLFTRDGPANPSGR